MDDGFGAGLLAGCILGGFIGALIAGSAARPDVGNCGEKFGAKTAEYQRCVAEINFPLIKWES